MVKPKQDITTFLSPGVPVSLRTLRRLTRMSHSAVLGAVHDAIRKGSVRRVHPIEVGSGKYVDTIVNKKDETELPGNKTSGTDKKRKKAAVVRSRPFNVFVLCQSFDQ